MAFFGDMKDYTMNIIYSEGLDNEPHRVRQTSSYVPMLEDAGGTDEILDDGRPWSAEDQEMLKWLPRTSNWRVRDSLTILSRLFQELCPDCNMGFSLFGKVTDSDTQQTRIKSQSLSSCRHVFYGVMLTKYSVSNVHPLFPRDGLPEDRSCLCLRSLKYINPFFYDAKPWYRMVWLVQLDVVDMTDYRNDGLATTGPINGFGINDSRPCLGPPTSEQLSDDPKKVSGIRFRKKRKSPWAAEVRPKGSKSKVSVGSYQTPAAQAPPNLDEQALKTFVFEQAHLLAQLAEKPSARGISETRSCNTNTGGLTSRFNLSNGNNFGQLPGQWRQSDDPKKFCGVRFRKNRKSPWSAEVKPKGSNMKISLGCYQTPAAAARAVDAGRYFYNLNLEKLNFPDSLRFLEKIEVPPNLNEKALKAFVYKQAHWLAKLTEKPPSTGVSGTRSCNTNTGGSTSRNLSSANNFEAHNVRPGANVSLAGLPIARRDGLATRSMDSGRDLQASLVEVKSSVLEVLEVLNGIQQNLNGCVRSSTSVGNGALREPVAPSSQDENFLLSTSNDRFATNSLVSEVDFHPELEPTYAHEASFAPVRNFSSGETTNDFINVLDAAWDENPEQDIPDDSARIRASDIPSVGVSDSNNLIHGTESLSELTNLTFPGYDFDLLGVGSEQAETNGCYERDMDLFDWPGFF